MQEATTTRRDYGNDHTFMGWCFISLGMRMTIWVADY